MRKKRARINPGTRPWAARGDWLAHPRSRCLSRAISLGDCIWAAKTENLPGRPGTAAAEQRYHSIGALAPQKPAAVPPTVRHVP